MTEDRIISVLIGLVRACNNNSKYTYINILADFMAGKVTLNGEEKFKMQLTVSF